MLLKICNTLKISYKKQTGNIITFMLLGGIISFVLGLLSSWFLSIISIVITILLVWFYYNNLKSKYEGTNSDLIRGEVEKYMTQIPCKKCNGTRLNEFALSVKIEGKNRLLVKCNDGYLELLSIQLEGKQRMDVSAFLNGCNKQELVKEKLS